MTAESDFRDTLRMFLSASYLPTDDPSRVATISERLAEVPDHVILNGWRGMMGFDPEPIMRGVKCPYLYIDCGQPDLDLDLLRVLCPQVVVGKVVGAGHKALQDVPDQINAMLNRFIRPRRRDRGGDGPDRQGVPLQLPRDLTGAGWVRNLAAGSSTRAVRFV